MAPTDGTPNLHGPEVNRAAGIVSVQANCSIEDAFVLMFLWAESVNLSMVEVGMAVLDHSISFDPKAKH